MSHTYHKLHDKINAHKETPIDKKSLGGFLAGTLVGGVAVSLYPMLKKRQTTATPDGKTFTWREEVAQAIDKEGFEYTFDGYSDFKEEVKDETFHKLRKSYLTQYKALNNYIKSKKKLPKYRSIVGAIDKDGFDYAMNSYSSWKEVKDPKFQELLSNYKKKRKALISYLGYDKSIKFATGGEFGFYPDAVTRYMFEEADGKRVKLMDGITYKIKCESYEAIYPYPQTAFKIYLMPVQTKSKNYMEIKKILKGDWLTSFDSLTSDNQILVLDQVGYYDSIQLKNKK